MKMNWITTAALCVAAGWAWNSDAQDASGRLSARQQEITRYYEQLTGTMNQRLKDVQDENARLAGLVDDLTRKVRQMEDDSRTMEKELRNLERQRKAEREALEQRLKQLSAQLDKLASLPPVPMPPPSVPSAQSGEYDEYTVQAGATLSQISKAFGVTISEIKRVNHLKTTNLRVGQKLRIPRKSK